MLSDKPPKIKLDISRKPMVDSIQNRKPLCIKRRPHKILVREASDAIQYGSSIYELTKYARSHRIPVEGRYDHLYFRIQQLLQGSSITSAYRRICDTFTKYFLYTKGQGQYVKACRNQDDFVTGQRLGNIPPVFIFCFEETSQNGGWYGFDIRSLYEFYASDANFINPYTCQPINNRITTDLIKKIRWVQKLGFPIRHQSQALTVQDAFCLRVITAFQKLNQLGFYVDYKWYMNLNIDELKRLYREVADVWNYRLDISTETKHRIVSNGVVFADTKSIDSHSDLQTVRNIVLRNAERIIDEGYATDDRKLGAFYFMIGLVIVSPEAASSNEALFLSAVDL